MLNVVRFLQTASPKHEIVFVLDQDQFHGRIGCFRFHDGVCEKKTVLLQTKVQVDGERLESASLCFFAWDSFEFWFFDGVHGFDFCLGECCGGVLVSITPPSAQSVVAGKIGLLVKLCPFREFQRNWPVREARPGSACSAVL